MKVFSALEPSTRRNLLVLFTAGLLFWSSLTTLLPTLSLYIKDIGATKHQIGIVMGAFAVGLLIFRPRLGRLADQQGRRIVLLIGLVVVAIAPLGYLFTTSIPFLMVIRAFHGLSIAAFTTGYSALVADLSPPRNRGELIGYMSLVNPIGMAIGPALGGFVQSGAGYTPLFLLSAGLGFIGFLCILWVMAPPLQTREQGSDLPTDEPFWRILLSPRLRTPTLMMLLIGLVFGVLSTFVPLFIQEAKVNLNAGLFYTAAAISSFGVRLPTGKASDRYGRGRFISFSLVLYTTAMLLLWTAHSQVGFLLAGVMEGAGSGIFIPMVVTLVADRSQPHERGRLFGLCLAGFDLGMAIAGPTLGFLADAVGYRGLFGFAASLTVLALLLFISQNSKDLIHSLRFALGAGKDLYALPHKSVG